jgi:hypothetical protein
VRLDGDRRGYVIALADPLVEALERAEAACRLLEVEVEPAPVEPTRMAPPRRDGCGFTLDHYGELLEAARAGGYRFAAFEGPPREGDLLLRHDVDLSLDAALRLAELESEHGAAATYFLMHRSVFYNLASEEGERAIARLRELGHRLGHHGVHPHLDEDARFDRVLAWHNPDPEYMRAPVDGLANVMEATYFSPDRYRSDSNQHWRSGCPHDALGRGELPWLQLLVQPEIWVYPGATMAETMTAFLDADRRRRLELLRADRIDV